VRFFALVRSTSFPFVPMNLFFSCFRTRLIFPTGPTPPFLFLQPPPTAVESPSFPHLDKRDRSLFFFCFMSPFSSLKCPRQTPLLLPMISFPPLSRNVFPPPTSVSPLPIFAPRVPRFHGEPVFFFLFFFFCDFSSTKVFFPVEIRSPLPFRDAAHFSW